MISDELLKFIEHDLQAIALTWMGVLYSLKIYQLSRLPMPWERESRKGNPTQGQTSSASKSKSSARVYVLILELEP